MVVVSRRKSSDARVGEGDLGEHAVLDHSTVLASVEISRIQRQLAFDLSIHTVGILLEVAGHDHHSNSPGVAQGPKGGR